MRNLLSSILMLLAICQPAFADNQTNFSKILSDPNERQHVLNAAGRSTVMVNNPCTSAQFNLTDKVAIYQPPAFDGSGAIISGAWKQVIDEQGCGAHRTLNVLAWVQSSKNLSTSPLLPGTTHADPTLQKDAVSYAVMAAGGSETNCQIGYVADTEFVQHEDIEAGDTKRPAWSERWTLMSCTKKTIVPMKFIPDATGVQIVAGPNTAIQVLPLDTK